MKTKIAKASLAAGMALMVAVPAFAQIGVGVDANLNANTSVNSGSVNTNTNASVNASATGTSNSGSGSSGSGSVRTQATTSAKSDIKGTQAITARINGLNSLSARIANMDRLTTEQQTALRATLQSEIGDLMNLQARMQTSTTTLKADFQALGANGRIYALVEPQVSILAAINRVDNIIAMLKMVAGKLEVRIGTATTTEDVADLKAALAEMNASLNNAQAKASTSMSLIINLKPDNGSQTVMKTNLDALKKSRTTLKDAAQDLNDARKTAVMIMKDLNISASSTASVKAQN